MWETPIYKLRSLSGKRIDIDVTTSCAPGLSANTVIFKVAKYLKKNDANSVLDFGAGALRHTFPLLDRGFSVCAVEFEDQFKRPTCQRARSRADKRGGFSSLIFPKPFIKTRRKFDAALLSFVLPTMPRNSERRKLLRLIQKKLHQTSYVFWMSQYGKYEKHKKQSQRVEDGWYLYPKRKRHSFYCEFKDEEIDKMMKRIGFKFIKRFGQSGHDQFRLYSRGGGTWP